MGKRTYRITNYEKDTHKICKDCKESKLLEDYHFANKKKTVRAVFCKSCARERVKITLQNTDWDKKRARQRKYQHGITPEQFVVMVQKQKGDCAICKNKLDIDSKETHIDHDHETGKVRGLLCRSCNWALGHFKDDLNTIKNAVLYLEEHNVSA